MNSIGLGSIFGELVLLNGSERAFEADQDAEGGINLIAVHGIENAVNPYSISSWQQDDGVNKSWLTTLLPLYVRDSHSATYNYSIPQDIEVSTMFIRAHAERLLDGISTTITKSKKFVFLGHDLGGLIIKEALSIARRNEKYCKIAGNTSMLIFFATPHRSTLQMSWESLAHWLLLVSGQNQHFSLRRVQVAAEMIKSVCINFTNSERLYRVMNIYYNQTDISHDREYEGTNWLSLDESSATFGIPQELKEGYNEYHGRLCTISSASNPLFERLYRGIIDASRPGQSFIQLLEILASISSSNSHGSSPLGNDLRDGPSSETLNTLVEQEEFHQWKSSPQGPLGIILPSGGDLSILSSKLKTAPEDLGISSKPTVISYTLNARNPDGNNEITILASLCYQLLSLKPQLFKYVAELNNCLGNLEDDRTFYSHELFTMFQSLLSCPYDGETICILVGMDGTEFPGRVVTEFISLSRREERKLRLIFISNSSVNMKIPVIVMKQREFELGTIINLELDNLISNRPGLLRVRNILQKGLLAHHDNHPNLFVGLYDEVIAAIRAWLELIIRISEPVSVSSMTNALDSMPDKIQDIYASILQQIPCRSRSQLRNVLSWLALFQGPLRLADLAAASAIEDNVHTINVIHNNSPVDISSDVEAACGSILEIDSDGYFLMPVGLRAFLMHEYSKEKPSNHEESRTLNIDNDLRLAEKCLVFLSLYKKEDPHAIFVSKENHPFMEYAIQHWPAHYAKGKASNMNSSKCYEFFQDAELIMFWATMHRLFRQRGHRDSVDPFRTPTNPLAIAAQVGCYDLVQSLLSSMDPNKEDNASIIQDGLMVAISEGNIKIVDAFIAIAEVSPLAIHIAALAGQRDLLKRLKDTIPAKDIFHIQNSQGLTPLQCACQSGVLGVVEDLLDEGADANAPGNIDGATPLHIACMFGHSNIISRLIQIEELDVNAQDKLQRTPLFYACKWQQPDAVRVLLQDHENRRIDLGVPESDQNATALCHSSGEGRLDIVRMILEYGNRVGASDLPSQTDSSGLTALHHAANNGHYKIVNEFIHHSNHLSTSKLLVKDLGGRLPIHLACKNGHTNVVELLLTSLSVVREQLSWETNQGDVAIHLAVLNGHIEVVKILAEAHQRIGLSLDTFDGQEKSALHLAAMTGQVVIVKLLVQYGATLDILDWEEETPLLLACRHGCEAVVTFLIEKGADAEISDEHKITPLLAAAEIGSASIMKILEPSEKSWDAIDSGGRNALHLAVQSDEEDAVNFVLENSSLKNAKDEDGKSALDYAIQTGHLSLIRKLWDGDVKPDENGRTILHMAARAGRYDSVKYLVSLKEPHPDTKDSEGRTALSLAAEEGHIDVVKFLVTETSAGREGADSAGNTPLFYASEKGHLDVVKSLMHDLPIANNLNRGPLWAAVVNQRTEVVKFLLEQGTDPNMVEEGQSLTPLHCAVRNNYLEIVDLLLAAKGIDGHAKDIVGRTPIYIASWNGLREMVKKLAQAGWAGNFPSDRGWYPIHAAFDDHEILSFLIGKVETDVNRVTNEGSTALHLAARSYPDSVRVLLEKGAKPLLRDNEDITPLDLVLGCSYPSAIWLMIKKAFIENPTSSEDRSMKSWKSKENRNILLEIISSGNADVVRYMMDKLSSHFLVDSHEGSAAVDIALEINSPETLSVLLHEAESILDLETLRRALIWATKKGDTGSADDSLSMVKNQLIELLQNKEPGEPWEDEYLLEFAMENDDLPLAKLLQYRGLGKTANRRDKQHNWTLEQIIAAFEPGSSKEATQGDKPVPPSEWDKNRMAVGVVPVNPGNPPILQIRYEDNADIWNVGSALSNHPVPPAERFYFEITIVEFGSYHVGIGFGRKGCSVDRAAGWESDTWALHGDDGGFFHGYGLARENGEIRYLKGDVIGVCIDVEAGMAFYTKNGEVIEIGFKGLRGRLFPMASLGNGAQIEANFGADLTAVPFKYPEGRDRDYGAVTKFIGDMS